MTSLDDIRMIERELGWDDRIASASLIVDGPAITRRTQRTNMAISTGLVLLCIVTGALIGGALYLVYLL